MILRKLYLFFVMLLLSTMSYAVVDSCLKINETRWQQFSQDKSYVETFTDTDEKEKEKNKSEFKMPSMNFEALKYVFYVLVGGSLLFLLVKIIQNMNTSPSITIPVDTAYTLSEIEDKILEIDLDKILEEALLAKDFRLALRINFLIIIKKLSLSGKIIWAKEKTNWEYCKAIQDEKIGLQFKNIVSEFEPIWYGEREFTENQFYELKPSYEALKNNLT